jgi:hypothetical protein
MKCGERKATGSKLKFAVANQLPRQRLAPAELCFAAAWQIAIPTNY